MTKKIALDSMCFIYHFEQTQPYFQRVENLLSHAQTGKSQIVTSIISVLETLSSPKYSTQPEVVKEINLFFAETGYIGVFGVDWEIAQEAARLRRENKSLRTPDSIQLATALTHQANIIVTNDARLKKFSLPGLKILFLSQVLKN